MPVTTTTTRRSNHNHQHQQQRQASAGGDAQLVVIVVLVLDLRMVVVEVSGTCYLRHGMRRNTYLSMYAYFSQDDPSCLVCRPSNSTKLRELGTALHTTSRGGWICYLAAFRNAVRFEIGVVAHVTEGDVRII